MGNLYKVASGAGASTGIWVLLRGQEGLVAGQVGFYYISASRGDSWCQGSVLYFLYFSVKWAAQSLSAEANL